MKWAVAENLRDEARGLIQFRDRLMAPDLIFPELANICWRKATNGQMRPDQAPLVIATVRAVITGVRPTEGYADRAVAIALMLGHPAYDAIYLACAEASDAVLVTADSRLARKIGSTPLAPRVVTLDDPALSSRLALGHHPSRGPRDAGGADGRCCRDLRQAGVRRRAKIRICVSEASAAGTRARRSSPTWSPRAAELLRRPDPGVAPGTCRAMAVGCRVRAQPGGRGCRILPACSTVGAGRRCHRRRRGASGAGGQLAAGVISAPVSTDRAGAGRRASWRRPCGCSPPDPAGTWPRCSCRS